MKNFTFAIVPLCYIFFSVGSMAQIGDNNPYLKIHNRSDYTITGIFLQKEQGIVWYPSSGNTTTPPGNSASIEFDNKRHCVVRVKVTLNNGSEPQATRNVCVVHDLTLTKDLSLE